jgi:hypothetical protein
MLMEAGHVREGQYMNPRFVNSGIDDRLASNENTAVCGDSLREHDDGTQVAGLTLLQQLRQRNSLKK